MSSLLLLLWFLGTHYFLIKIPNVATDTTHRGRFYAKEGNMTAREAIGILMLSPFYFRLSPENRKQLIKEFCGLFTWMEKTGKT